MMGKPKIRFKGYNEDWEQRKLGEVATFINGRAYSQDELLNFGKYKVLRVGNFYTNDSWYYSDMELDDKYYAENGDLLYTWSATFGPHIWRGNKVIYHYHIWKIELSKTLEKNFALQLLERDKQAILSDKNGSTMVHITKAGMERKEVLLPQNIVEQAKIGEYFSTLDHLITLHQHKCDEMKRLKKYMLQKMFPQNGKKVPEIRFDGFTNDWEQRKLGDLVLDHNAGIYISKENYGEGINVIGVGNIYDSDIFYGEIYRLGPVNDDKFLLEEDDIIYGESSLVPEGIARTVCVGKNGAGSAFAWHTRRVKLDNNIVNSHVATLELNYLHDVRKYLVSVSTQTALTGITTDGYFGTTLVLPSVEEQHKISDYFKSIDHLITLHQHKCDELQNLKKYMLQNMFV